MFNEGRGIMTVEQLEQNGPTAEAVLGWRFLKTGGPEMLRAMAVPPGQQAEQVRDPVCGMTVDPMTSEYRSVVRVGEGLATINFVWARGGRLSPN